MMNYKNWIFDLYGTLVDIRTDESSISLWKTMANIYRSYGAEYTPLQLKKAYEKICKEENKKLQKSALYPEINLLIVFERLLNEAQNKNALYIPRHDETWNTIIAQTFRVLSRQYIKPYKDTHTVLQELKNQGCHLYLLSNAQACFTLPELVICDLVKYFDQIYISSEYGVKKPDTKFMSQLLEDHQLDVSQCIMVGNDFSSDIKIADDIGMNSIFINTDRHKKSEMNAQMKQVNHKPIIIDSGRLKEIFTIGELSCRNG